MSRHYTFGQHGAHGGSAGADRDQASLSSSSLQSSRSSFTRHTNASSYHSSSNSNSNISSHRMRSSQDRTSRHDSRNSNRNSSRNSSRNINRVSPSPSPSGHGNGHLAGPTHGPASTFDRAVDAAYGQSTDGSTTTGNTTTTSPLHGIEGGVNGPTITSNRGGGGGGRTESPSEQRHSPQYYSYVTRNRNQSTPKSSFSVHSTNPNESIQSTSTPSRDSRNSRRQRLATHGQVRPDTTSHHHHHLHNNSMEDSELNHSYQSFNNSSIQQQQQQQQRKPIHTNSNNSLSPRRKSTTIQSSYISNLHRNQPTQKLSCTNHSSAPSPTQEPYKRSSPPPAPRRSPCPSPNNTSLSSSSSSHPAHHHHHHHSNHHSNHAEYRRSPSPKQLYSVKNLASKYNSSSRLQQTSSSSSFSTPTTPIDEGDDPIMIDHHHHHNDGGGDDPNNYSHVDGFVTPDSSMMMTMMDRSNMSNTSNPAEEMLQQPNLTPRQSPPPYRSGGNGTVSGTGTGSGSGTGNSGGNRDRRMRKQQQFQQHQQHQHGQHDQHGQHGQDGQPNQHEDHRRGRSPSTTATSTHRNTSGRSHHNHHHHPQQHPSYPQRDQSLTRDESLTRRNYDHHRQIDSTVASTTTNTNTNTNFNSNSTAAQQQQQHGRDESLTRKKQDRSIMGENAVDHGINSNGGSSSSSSNGSTVRKNQFHRYQEHTARMRSKSRGESLTPRQREHSQINDTTSPPPATTTTTTTTTAAANDKDGMTRQNQFHRHSDRTTRDRSESLTKRHDNPFHRRDQIQNDHGKRDESLTRLQGRFQQQSYQRDSSRTRDESLTRNRQYQRQHQNDTSRDESLTRQQQQRQSQSQSQSQSKQQLDDSNVSDPGNSSMNPNNVSRRSRMVAERQKSRQKLQQYQHQQDQHQDKEQLKNDLSNNSRRTMEEQHHHSTATATAAADGGGEKGRREVQGSSEGGRYDDHYQGSSSRKIMTDSTNNVHSSSGPSSLRQVKSVRYYNKDKNDHKGHDGVDNHQQPSIRTPSPTSKPHRQHRQQQQQQDRDDVIGSPNSVQHHLQKANFWRDHLSKQRTGREQHSTRQGTSNHQHSGASLSPKKKNVLVTNQSSTQYQQRRDNHRESESTRKSDSDGGRNNTMMQDDPNTDPVQQNKGTVSQKAQFWREQQKRGRNRTPSKGHHSQPNIVTPTATRSASLEKRIPTSTNRASSSGNDDEQESGVTRLQRHFNQSGTSQNNSKPVIHHVQEQSFTSYSTDPDTIARGVTSSQQSSPAQPKSHRDQFLAAAARSQSQKRTVRLQEKIEKDSPPNPRGKIGGDSLSSFHESHVIPPSQTFHPIIPSSKQQDVEKGTSSEEGMDREQREKQGFSNYERNIAHSHPHPTSNSNQSKLSRLQDHIGRGRVKQLAIQAQASASSSELQHPKPIKKTRIKPSESSSEDSPSRPPPMPKNHSPRVMKSSVSKVQYQSPMNSTNRSYSTTKEEKTSLNASIESRHTHGSSGTATTEMETTFEDSHEASRSFQTQQLEQKSFVSSNDESQTNQSYDTTSLLSINEVKKLLWDPEEKLLWQNAPTDAAKKVLHSTIELPESNPSPFKGRYYAAAVATQANNQHQNSGDKAIDNQKLEEASKLTNLVEKLNSVKRDDPKAALAQIDSILRSQGSSLLKLNTEVQNENTFNQKIHNSAPHNKDDREVDEASSPSHTSSGSYESESDDSTVSSMTNPTYQSGLFSDASFSLSRTGSTKNGLSDSFLSTKVSSITSKTRPSLHAQQLDERTSQLPPLHRPMKNNLPSAQNEDVSNENQAEKDTNSQSEETITRGSKRFGGISSNDHSQPQPMKKEPLHKYDSEIVSNDHQMTPKQHKVEGVSKNETTSPKKVIRKQLGEQAMKLHGRGQLFSNQKPAVQRQVGEKLVSGGGSSQQNKSLLNKFSLWDEKSNGTDQDSEDETEFEELQENSSNRMLKAVVSPNEMIKRLSKIATQTVSKPSAKDPMPGRSKVENRREQTELKGAFNASLERHNEEQKRFLYPPREMKSAKQQPNTSQNQGHHNSHGGSKTFKPIGTRSFDDTDMYTSFGFKQEKNNRKNVLENQSDSELFLSNPNFTKKFSRLMQDNTPSGVQT